MSRQDLKNSRRSLQEGKSASQILSKINNGDSAAKARIASVLKREEGLLGRVVVDPTLLRDCPTMHGLIRKACISSEAGPMGELSGDSQGKSTVLFVLQSPDCSDCPKHSSGHCGEVNLPILSSVDQMQEGAIDDFSKIIVDSGIATASEVGDQLGEEDPYREVARLASWAQARKENSGRTTDFAGEIRSEVEQEQLGRGHSLDDVINFKPTSRIAGGWDGEEMFSEEDLRMPRTANVLDSMDSLTGMDLELQTLSDLSETAAFDSEGGYGDLEDRSFGQESRKASEDVDFQQVRQEQLESHLSLVKKSMAGGGIRMAHVTPLLDEIKKLSAGLKIPEKFEGTIQQLRNMLGDLG